MAGPGSSGPPGPPGGPPPPKGPAPAAGSIFAHWSAENRKCTVQMALGLNSPSAVNTAPVALPAGTARCSASVPQKSAASANMPPSRVIHFRQACRREFGLGGPFIACGLTQRLKNRYGARAGVGRIQSQTSSRETQILTSAPAILKRFSPSWSEARLFFVKFMRNCAAREEHSRDHIEALKLGAIIPAAPTLNRSAEFIPQELPMSPRVRNTPHTDPSRPPAD